MVRGRAFRIFLAGGLRSSRAFVRLLSFALVVLGALVVWSGRAGATAPAEAVRLLNAQRAAAGIPAGVVEVPQWSAACAAHMRYLQLNHAFGHEEDPTKPGYTESGAWAGQHSVLATSSSGGIGWEDGNPWELAPIHLTQLLGPGLSKTGWADGCMITWPGYERSADGVTPRLLLYPSPQDPLPFGGVYGELPYGPGELLGIPDGTSTGPYFYVFPWGEGVGRGHVTSVTLSGAQGAVDILLADDRTKDAAGRSLNGFLPTATGVVIVREPLQPDRSYRLTVTWREDPTTDTGLASPSPQTLTRTDQFRTKPLAPSQPTGHATKPADSDAVISASRALRALTASSTGRVALAGITIRCPPDSSRSCPVSADITTARKIPVDRRKARKLRLVHTRLTIRPGRRTAIMLTLSRDALKVLKRLRRVRVHVVITARSSTGRLKRKTLTITLNAPPRRPGKHRRAR